MNRHALLRARGVVVALLALPGTGLQAQQSAAALGSQSAAARTIEVCFVLDTTGSMTGLIEGAKAKIWSIANQLIAARPTPRLKLALIA